MVSSSKDLNPCGPFLLWAMLWHHMYFNPRNEHNLKENIQHTVFEFKWQNFGLYFTSLLCTMHVCGILSRHVTYIALKRVDSHSREMGIAAIAALRAVARNVPRV